MRNGYTPGKNDGANRRRRRTKNNENGANAGDYLTGAKQGTGWKTKHPAVERPRWKEPALLTTPIPVPFCPLCGKPIKDLSEALTDKMSGLAAHFECVREILAANERLDEGDRVAYIGGGRFGIVNFGAGTREAAAKGHCFNIKKIIEFEETGVRAGWRTDIEGHYSLT